MMADKATCGAHFHYPSSSVADGCNQSPGAVIGDPEMKIKYTKLFSEWSAKGTSRNIGGTLLDEPFRATGTLSSFEGAMAIVHRHDGTFASCGQCKLVKAPATVEPAKPAATAQPLKTGDAPATVFFTAAVAAAGAALF
jgi:hypothetical protein